MAAELKPPIILLGNVRSGTTMLQNLFAMHPEIVTWFEPRTIWTYADPGRRHDRFVAEDATDRVARYIRKRFLRYQRANDNLRIMEKTPSNVLRIPYAQQIFPEARFIYVLREPFSQISSSELRWRHPNAALKSWKAFRRRWRHMKSWRRLSETPFTQLHHYLQRAAVEMFNKKVLRREYLTVWGVRYPGIYEDLKEYDVLEVIARQWAQCASIAQRDIEQSGDGSILTLRYEEFVQDPAAQFERLCQHVGLQVDDQMVQRVCEYVDPNRQEKWRRFDRQLLARLRPHIEDAARRFGYPLPSPEELAMDDCTISPKGAQSE